MRQIRNVFRENTRKLIILGLNFFLFSCATIQYEKLELPIMLLSEFDSCRTGDGSLQINIMYPERLPMFEIDWAIQNYPSIAMESYNPMGQTVAAIYYDKDKNIFKGKGALRELSQRLSVVENYLYADGYNTGLKINELSCMLKTKLPRKWLNRVVDARSQNNTKYKFNNVEGGRVVETELEKKSSDFSSCSRFVMHKYFGLVSYSWDYCVLANDKTRKAKIIYDNQEILSLTILDE